MKVTKAIKSTLGTALVAVFMSTAVPAAFAHGDAEHGKAKGNAPISTDEHTFGKEGDPKKATRTIKVDMSDKMRFTPGEITIRQGDTVKFFVTNNGQVMHEMVIGTMDELKKHGELMKKFPEMEHDEPYMSHVSPSKKGELVWQFTKAGEFYFACLIPGHFEAGMIGKIKVIKG